MSDKPQDPAQGAIDQGANFEETYDGQKGPGVEFEQERFQSDDVQQPPDTGRSGSYETNNTGGYGQDEPTLPPDPEAQQGQGGQ